MSINGGHQHIRVDNVLQTGCWHHVAGTYDGSHMRVYLDGVEVGNLPITGTVEAGNDEIYLSYPSGASPGAETLDGLLDEVKIYNRALDATEIQAIYEAGDPNKMCQPAFVTIQSTLTYNGAPLVSAQVPQGQGNHEVDFWGYQGESDWDFTVNYNYNDGTFTIEDVPPGDYSISVKVDPIAPFDFGMWPGNFRGDLDFSVPEGQPTVQIDLPCQIWMHLTSPVDNESSVGPSPQPPPHSWMSPVSFVWDAVDEALSYTYSVYRSYTDSTPSELIIRESIEQTQVDISLDPSGVNDYYTFHVYAMNPTNDQLGRLNIVWDSGTTSSYYFLVSPSDVTPPAVTGFDPIDGATGVAFDANLVITFDENVVLGTGNIVIKKSSDDSVFETIDVESGKVTAVSDTVTINPDGTFANSTGYYVQIGGTCFKDSAGNYYGGINDDITWNFTTANIGNLVAHYPFNGNADDESGNGNHGDPVGPTLTTDRFGILDRAYSFDGLDDGIIIPNSSSLSVDNFQTGYTIAAWVRIMATPTGYEVIVSKGSACFEIRTSSDLRIETCHVYDGGASCQAHSGFDLSVNVWQFVAVTWNANTGDIHMYLNGDPAPPANHTTLIVSNTDDRITIGRDSWYDRWFFKGMIDDVFIYNRGLTEVEIKALYNSTR